LTDDQQHERDDGIRVEKKVDRDKRGRHEGNKSADDHRIQATSPGPQEEIESDEYDPHDDVVEVGALVLGAVMREGGTQEIQAGENGYEQRGDID